MAINPSISFNQCNFVQIQLHNDCLYFNDFLIETNHKLIESKIASFLGLDEMQVQETAVTIKLDEYIYGRGNCIKGLTLEQVQHLFTTTHNPRANKYKPILSELILTQVLPLFNKQPKHDDFKKEINIMPNLTTIDQPLTMSSQEIAKLCDKQHKDVLYDIRNMLEQLEINMAEFSAVYKASNGQRYECFNLNKELSLTLVAGYNVKLRHKIIQRWQELENQTATPALPVKNYADALAVLGVPQEIVPAVAKVYEERDEAIKTKAWINDKKVASAMGTAGALANKIKQLEAKLTTITPSSEYATVRAVERFVTGVKINWRLLRQYCLDNGLKILQVDDNLYGSVKSYPAKAWEKVYGVKLNEILKGA